MGTGSYNSQSGSALIYILLAAALLALVTTAMMDTSGSSQNKTQTTAKIVSGIQSQIAFIDGQVNSCLTNYPNQDDGIAAVNQPTAPYPLNPKDSYFTTATPGIAASQAVRYIRCPGNPGGTGASAKNHKLIFDANDSDKDLPQPPDFFEEWEYYNGADGVFIVLRTKRTDAAILPALQKVEAKFSKCQVDIINATNLPTQNISSDTARGDAGVKTCAGGYKCLRYWFVQKSTATPLESGCP